MHTHDSSKLRELLRSDVRMHAYAKTDSKIGITCGC